MDPDASANFALLLHAKENADMRIAILALLAVLVLLNVVEIALYTDRMEDLCYVVDRLQELRS